MTHFKEYSNYYDLLYKDKDYTQEIEYLNTVITNIFEKKISILDIGCGTGIHANLLMKKGHTVHGMDISENMLENAKNNFGKEIDFTLGDIRNFKINKKFDIISSLFHVVSYQTTNQDLENSFESINNHLNPSGYFIFDCWYGPAVIHDRPIVRVKKFNNDALDVTRIATPIIDYNKSIVNVNFEIFINNKNDNSLIKLFEVHPMRFLFLNEIEMLAKNHGFTIEKVYKWMTFEDPNENSWYAFFILKKIN